MTNTPKKLRDMTDAEIGALVRAHNDGKKIEFFEAGYKWSYGDLPCWSPDDAYRIAPPKFLPLEVGKVYVTGEHGARECIRVDGDLAWLIFMDDGVGYVWNAKTGKSITLGPNYDITGLSENQEAGQ